MAKNDSRFKSGTTPGGRSYSSGPSPSGRHTAIHEPDHKMIYTKDNSGKRYSFYGDRPVSGKIPHGPKLKKT